MASIADNSPQGTRRAQARIRAVIDLLSQHPHAGRLTSKGSVRRIAAYPYPYLIFYRATEDEIVIHGVRHGARDPASMPD